MRPERREDVASEEEPVEVLRDLRLEGRIRAISWCYVLQGVCAAVVGAWYSTADILSAGDGQPVGTSLGRDVIVGVAVAMAIGIVALGIGVRRHAPAARWLAVIVAGLMLLGSLPAEKPRGDASVVTLVLGYATTVLLVAAAIGLVGGRVGRLFEDAYRQAMREEPERRGSVRSSAFFVVMILTALLALVTTVSSLLTRPPPIRPVPPKAAKGARETPRAAPAPVPAPDPSRWPAYVVRTAPPLGWKRVGSVAEGYVVTAPDAMAPFTETAPSPGGAFGLEGRRVGTPGAEYAVTVVDMPADLDVVEFLRGVPLSTRPDRLRSCEYWRVDGRPAVLATWSLEDGRVARQVVIVGKRRAARARVIHEKGGRATEAAQEFTDSLHLLED